MINREIEASFADWITSGVSGTSLAGVSIRSGVPSELTPPSSSRLILAKS